MNSNRDDTLFFAAQDLPGEERGAFLDRVCAGDAALRARIEGLLASAEEAVGFLKQPLVARGTVAPEEKPGDRIGRYKLLQKIGEGGCGVVYLAEQEEPVRRRVALKVIKLGMDTRAVIARFEAERQALALMDHANIAKVFDAGATDAGRPFFVMELVRGVSITHYCDEHQLTPPVRLELFIQVCHAIQHAHQKGIIHRDIKPSNILVTVNDGAPVPKVIDFGVAKATQGRLTEQTMFTAFEQFIGTPAYMSPEQADMSSLDVDTRSDIYSLGVLLYELLAGQPPFDAKRFAQAGVDEIRRQIREIEPPRPSSRLRTLREVDNATVARLRGIAPAQLSILLRGDLDWIVMRCLEKDRTRRYDTANGLATDIRRHLCHEPVVARPPSTAYLLQKMIRRHRFGFAAAAVVGALVVLGAGVSTWQAIRAKRAEREQGRLRVAAQSAQATEATLRQLAEAQGLAARRRAYAADMNLVQQFLEVENFGRALELLDRQRPAPGELDLRGWEWRYLWQFCRSDALFVLNRKEDTSINSLAVSSDGNWLAAAEEKYGNLSLWNLRTREEIRIPAGIGPVRVAFSPTEPLLAFTSAIRTETGGLNPSVLLWDVNTRRVVREIFAGRGPCTGMFFSEDGKTMVTSVRSPENEIVFWRVADGEKIAAFPAPATGVSGNRWTSFTVSRDLKLAVVRAPDDKVNVIDLETGKELWSAHIGEEGFTALAFSPDGRLLATAGGFAEGIRLWEPRTGAALGRLEGDRRPVRDLLFLSDGKLASGGADQVVRIWDVAARRLLRSLQGHTMELNTLALLPDHRTLVSGAKDGAIMFWDILAARTPRGVFTLPGGPRAWRFADASDAIVLVDQSGRVTERRGENFEKKKILVELGRVGSAVIMADDCRRVATVSGREIRIWDWESGTVVQTLKFAPDEGAAPFQLIDKGTTLLIGRIRADKTQWLEAWEVGTGRLRREWKAPGLDNYFPAVSSDGKYLVSAASHGRFLRVAADASYPDALIRTELATGRVAALPALTREMAFGTRFSPDSTLVVAPSVRGFADVIDVASWRRIATLSGNMSALHSTAFSPDGRRLATGCTGMLSLMLWDVGGYECLLTLGTASSAIDTVEFSKDGNLIGVSSASGTVGGGRDRGALYVWRAPSWAEIAAAEKR